MTESGAAWSTLCVGANPTGGCLALALHSVQAHDAIAWYSLARCGVLALRMGSAHTEGYMLRLCKKERLASLDDLLFARDRACSC